MRKRGCKTVARRTLPSSAQRGRRLAKRTFARTPLASNGPWRDGWGRKPDTILCKGAESFAQNAAHRQRGAPYPAFGHLPSCAREGGAVGRWPRAGRIAMSAPLWQNARRPCANFARRPHGLSCRSSVVEHSLGKGEVESSILSGSTISRRVRSWKIERRQRRRSIAEIRAAL